MKTKIQQIPTFETAEDIIQFRRVDNMPGFTHRVVINRGAYIGYLGDHCKPSRKAAQYFLNRWHKEMRPIID
ncbi:MAG: hypothetical protein HYY29_03840 [Chloroflexi bacterium]|nr:hypothetical protein [Chloroflexota bacterium]